jgi:hypothetical protein
MKNVQHQYASLNLPSRFFFYVDYSRRKMSSSAEMCSFIAAMAPKPALDELRTLLLKEGPKLVRLHVAVKSAEFSASFAILNNTLQGEVLASKPSVNELDLSLLPKKLEQFASFQQWHAALVSSVTAKGCARPETRVSPMQSVVVSTAGSKQLLMVMLQHIKAFFFFALFQTPFATACGIECCWASCCDRRIFRGRRLTCQPSTRC